MQELGYIDLNPNPTGNTYGDLLRDEKAVIVGSLSNLFRCPKGDRGRTYRPDYGSRFYELLQEPVDAITATAIRMTLVQTVERWEPRIRIDNANTGVVVDYDLPGYQLVIAFRFVGSDELHRASFALRSGGG